MDTPWARLLNELRLTDQQVYDTVVQACRREYGPRATEELCQALLSEVFISLNRMLLNNTGNEYFRTAPLFRGAIRTTVQRARGADIRERFDRKGPTVSYLPGDAFDQNPDCEENDFDWQRLRELMADCNKACEQCLTDARDEWREVFRLTCERVQRKEIATRLKVAVSTVDRRLEAAYTVFKLNCGHLWEGGK